MRCELDINFILLDDDDDDDDERDDFCEFIRFCSILRVNLRVPFGIEQSDHLCPFCQKKLIRYFRIRNNNKTSRRFRYHRKYY